MDSNTIEKIVKQAEANSNVENEKLDKKYLTIIKDALKDKQDNFLEDAYKVIKKEKNDKQNNK